MWSNPGNETRPARHLVACLLALAILTVPVGSTLAQDDNAMGPVVTQLEGIRAELGSISQLLQTLEKHQQVTLLMQRIRLKQQRLSLLETRLQDARDDEQDLGQEIEQLESIAQSYAEGLNAGDFGDDGQEGLQQELEFLGRQRSSAETRLEAQRANVIELENDLMRAREDVLALEETVDEQLGLR